MADAPISEQEVDSTPDTPDAGNTVDTTVDTPGAPAAPVTPGPLYGPPAPDLGGFNATNTAPNVTPGAPPVYGGGPQSTALKPMGLWQSVLQGALAGLSGVPQHGRGGFGGGLVGGAEGEIAQQQRNIANTAEAQRLKFESVRAADDAIRSSDAHRNANNLDKAAKIDYAQKSADFQVYLSEHPFAIDPDIQDNDTHEAAVGAMGTAAQANGGTVPPHAASIEPAEDGQHGKFSVYSPTQLKLQQNMTGFMAIINKANQVQGKPQMDPNVMRGIGFSALRDQALNAIDFMNPTSTKFSLDKNSATYLPNVIAQKQQQLDNYSKLPDADAATKTQLQNGIDYLQKSWDKSNTMEGEASATASLYKLENDPSQMSGEKAPAAIAMLQNKLTSPDLSPVDKPRVTRLLAQAQAGNIAYLAQKKSEEQTKQLITDGDPAAAALLLQQGAVAPAELVSSRKSGFATEAFRIAREGGTSADGKVTVPARPNWNAQKADADFSNAKSASSQAFFGSSNSLTRPGGTLEQLKAMGADLPKDLQIPVFNSWEQALAYHFTGNAAVSAYMATALGVADDYAKVTGGGTGSDTARLQALNIISAQLNRDQREGAIDSIRGTVNSQTKERIGRNQVAQQMWGEDPNLDVSGNTPPAAAASAAAPPARAAATGTPAAAAPPAATATTPPAAAKGGFNWNKFPKR